MPTACSVGQNYKRPAVQVPSAYKELPPAGCKEAGLETARLSIHAELAAERVSTRRGGRLVPPPSPVEAA